MEVDVARNKGTVNSTLASNHHSFLDPTTNPLNPLKSLFKEIHLNIVRCHLLPRHRQPGPPRHTDKRVTRPRQAQPTSSSFGGHEQAPSNSSKDSQIRN